MSDNRVPSLRRLGRTILAVLASGVVIALAAPRVDAQATPPPSTASGCRSDKYNPYIKSQVTKVFSSSHTYDVNRRVRYRLPGALPADVAQITTDTVVCRRFRDLHSAQLAAGYTAAADVFIFSVRGVYVVVEPGDHYTGWTFFNSAGVLLGKMAS